MSNIPRVVAPFALVLAAWACPAPALALEATADQEDPNVGQIIRTKMLDLSVAASVDSLGSELEQMSKCNLNGGVITQDGNCYAYVAKVIRRTARIDGSLLNDGQTYTRNLMTLQSFEPTLSVIVVPAATTPNRQNTTLKVNLGEDMNEKVTLSKTDATYFARVSYSAGNKTLTVTTLKRAPLQNVNINYKALTMQPSSDKITLK